MAFSLFIVLVSVHIEGLIIVMLSFTSYLFLKFSRCCCDNGGNRHDPLCTLEEDFGNFPFFFFFFDYHQNHQLHLNGNCSKIVGCPHVNHMPNNTDNSRAAESYKTIIAILVMLKFTSYGRLKLYVINHCSSIVVKSKEKNVKTALFQFKVLMIFRTSKNNSNIQIFFFVVIKFYYILF